GTNGTWKEVAPMSVKRSNFAAAVWDDKLFVFGGEQNSVEQTVEYFDGEKWNSFCSLPSDHTPLAALNWKNV
uniref:Uncharacterized protein n=1 Tax=Panagrolaimus sp. PS1159 TaxID=55785 RepID=A0AC35GDQ9_9BILA